MHNENAIDYRQYMHVGIAIIIILALLLLGLFTYYEFRPSNIYIDQNIAKKIVSKMLREDDEKTAPKPKSWDEKTCSQAILSYMVNPEFRLERKLILSLKRPILISK
jgi:hypothetical protein